MKPKPLNLRDVIGKWEEEKEIAEKDGDNGYATICSLVIKDLNDIKQRIKSACEFYLKYKNKPELLVKEHYYLLKKMEREDMWAFTLLFAVPDLKIKDIDKYNEWFFELSFEDVLKEEKNETCESQMG